MPLSGSHLSLSREELYELVWSKPMQHLAKDYGVSDRAMAKLCVRNQVPVPSRGYWAKKQSGHRVVQPPLLPFIPKIKEKKEPPIKESVTLAAPERKRRRILGVFNEREKKIKHALKEFRGRFTGGTHYTILVNEWSCNYSFGLNSRFNPLRDEDDVAFMYREPYDEMRWLVFRGMFFNPTLLKGERVDINLWQRSYLNEKERNKNLHLYSEAPPKSVGSLQKEPARYWGFVSLPEDAMNIVLAAATAGKIKAITLYTEKMRYRQASILNFSLQEKVEEMEEGQDVAPMPETE